MTTKEYRKKEGEVFLVKSLKFLSFNPPARVEDSPALRELLEDVKERGILQPISVNAETNQVVDGHRRVTVARLLGIEKITATAYYGLSKAQMHKLYYVMNGPGLKQPHKNSHWLQVIHLGGPGPRGMEALYATLAGILSPAELDEYVQRGAGLYSTARAWSRRLGMENKAFMRKCIVWMMETNSWRDAIDAYRNKPRISNQRFLSAMEKGKRIFPRAEKKPS